MNIAFWIVIALVCIVIPSVDLTGGGRKAPDEKALRKHVKATGLPLTHEVAGPVVDRIRRREHGMLLGGVGAIVLCVALSLLIRNDMPWEALIVILAGAGTGFGGAWAMAAHHPAATSDTPEVARARSVELADYLTRGERFGLWASPVTLGLGAAGGSVLLLQLPPQVRGAAITLGLIGTGVALLTWLIGLLSQRRVLAAPARSGSDLELAWDDAERALGLRQLLSQLVVVSCLTLGLWVLLIGHQLTTTGFYRSPEGMPVTNTLVIATIIFFTTLIIIAAAGPLNSWITGRRRGYEQRQLCPNGVSVQ